jgi:hypothetical protein
LISDSGLLYTTMSSWVKGWKNETGYLGRMFLTLLMM